jgi:hypothetical protein
MKYRNGQDHIAAFIKELIVKTGDKSNKILKRTLNEAFSTWFQQEQGSRKVPKSDELYALMDKKFGANQKGTWFGVKFCEIEEGEEDYDNQ